MYSNKYNFYKLRFFIYTYFLNGQRRGTRTRVANVFVHIPVVDHVLSEVIVYYANSPQWTCATSCHVDRHSQGDQVRAPLTIY